MTRLSLWTADLDAPRAFESRLSEEESDRAARFLEPLARRRWIASRLWLRVALARYTGLPVERITLKSGPLGKPRLADSNLEFSLSHSAARVLIGISDQHSIGVDIEKSEPGREDFLREWTTREAYLKAVGLGLAAGLDTPLPAAGWTIRHVESASGYFAAVAIDATPVKLEVRSLA